MGDSLSALLGADGGAGAINRSAFSSFANAQTSQSMLNAMSAFGLGPLAQQAALYQPYQRAAQTAARELSAGELIVMELELERQGYDGFVMRSTEAMLAFV